MNPERQDVLIVGAGPADLFAACELARYGVMPRVVERQLVPHRQARATAIQPAGLELLAHAGVLAPFLEASVHVRRTRFFGPGRTEIGVSDFAGICCPYEYQCCLPQWQTESILLAHLHRLGGAVERGTTVMSVEDDAAQLNVVLRRPYGEMETTLARYMLGPAERTASLAIRCTNRSAATLIPAATSSRISAPIWRTSRRSR